MRFPSQEESSLTDYIQLVGVVDAAVLVLHHAGVVPFVRGDDGLHDDGPHVFPDLKFQTRIQSWRLMKCP